MEALLTENSDLREKLLTLEDALEGERNRLPSTAPGPVRPLPSIQVIAPPPPPRLKVFTGLAPTGGNEIAFREWEAQTVQLIEEDYPDATHRIRGSLRGLAKEQAKGKADANAILTHMRKLYSDIRPADDLVQEFMETRMTKKEVPSEFLLRLWDSLVRINSAAKLTEEEQGRKLYRVFTRALDQTQSLLCLEIRTKFGAPGITSPKIEELLQAVKQLEENSSKPTGATAHTHVHAASTGLSELDIDRIAARVIQLQGRTPQGSTWAPSARGQEMRRRVRGPCYRCGEIGHYARQCGKTPTSGALNDQQLQVGSNPQLFFQSAPVPTQQGTSSRQ